MKVLSQRVFLSIVAVLLAGWPHLTTASEPAPQPSFAEIAGPGGYLPIDLTPEELLALDRIGEAHRGTPPPPAPVRQPAEFEPMTGLIVRYPFGNPTNLLKEYAEDVTLWVIVADSTEEATADSILEAAGCNLSHLSFITAPTNSFWTRDYGPWFVFTGDDVQGMVDNIYNRPRPDDDLIPGVLGSAWGIPVYGMDLVHSGGNYMTDGRGIAMSSRLVIDENPNLTPTEIDSIMHVYCGIEQYEKLPYVEERSNHHIDCWAKFLSPEKLLVKMVPPDHPDYARIEANAAYLSTLESSYGTPYEIVRVYAPNNEPYVNSLILNDKVFVPLSGTEWDDDAIATYEAAMPGYEVLGFTGFWSSNDALHCRVMGVTDRSMLYIDHVPLSHVPNGATHYRIEANIIDYSEAGLVADSLVVYWRTAGATAFTPLAMSGGPGDLHYADVTAQPVGTEIDYYIFAKDNSGRRESHPYVAPGDMHRFHVIADTEAPLVEHTPLDDVAPSAWPPTVVARVTDNTLVDAVTLESWINGSRQPDVAMARVGWTAEYRAALSGSVAPGDAVEYRVRAIDAARPANIAYEPPQGVHYFEIVQTAGVVIWEPDPSPLSGPVLGALFDDMHVEYDYTTTIPAFAHYAAAFICLGVSPESRQLSASEADTIVAYLDGGGRVYMEGGDCWAYDPVGPPIYNGHFGIDGTDDGTSDLSVVRGEAGTPTSDMSFSYAGGNEYIDHVSPLPGAVQIFRNPADDAGCGIMYDAGNYRTVGCSFELGGLVDVTLPSTRAGLVSWILGFFGISATGVPDEEGSAGLALLQNRPNPFNPVTTLVFDVPARGPLELAVYSAAGRKVATLASGEFDAGRFTVSWRGLDDAGEPVASGVYFFSLTQHGESVFRKGVLLK
jgi:agmatine deiminase